MKVSHETILKAVLVGVGVILGTGGTIGVQKTSSPSQQIIQIKPECPSIYLDRVKVSK